MLRYCGSPYPFSSHIPGTGIVPQAPSLKSVRKNSVGRSSAWRTQQKRHSPSSVRKRSEALLSPAAAASADS